MGKKINELPSVSQVNDDDLLVLEQLAQAHKLTGEQLKGYAEDAATEAVTPLVTRAETAATNAQSAATSAGNSANGASTSASAAATSADNAAASAQTAVQAAESASEDAQSASNDADMAQVMAESVKGLIPSSTSKNYPDTPILDVVPQGATSAPVLSSVIKGKTVAWNQISQQIAASITANGVTITPNEDGSVTLNGTATAAGILGGFRSVGVVAGHVYYFRMISSATVEGLNGFTNIGGNTATSEAIRTAATTSSTATCSVRGDNGAVYNNVKVWVMTIDLTAAGYTAAETTDVATFKAAFLKRMGYPLPQYIPYDAGSLKNVDGTFALTGRNLWDEEWELGNIDITTGEPVPASNYIRSKNFNRVQPDTEYCAKAPTVELMRVFWYDAGKKIIDVVLIPQNNAVVVTSPSNACYFKIKTFATTYNNDICINLSDPSFNGQYEPYYNGGTIDCSGAPLNGVGSAQDEVDYAKGTRTTKIGVVDLGMLTWIYDTSNTRFYAVISGAKEPNYDTLLSPRYTPSNNPIGGHNIDLQISTYGGRIYLTDFSYTDGVALKASLDGSYFAYELATPVVSTETPQPLTTQDGYNLLRPVSGDVQSAEIEIEYAQPIAYAFHKFLPTDTASGAVASFPDGADDVPVKDLVVSIEPVPSGTGDPSPDNVRPITGWTGANVTRTGKNLMAKPMAYMGDIADDISNAFFVKAGTYAISFLSTSATSWRFAIRIYNLDGTQDTVNEPFNSAFYSTSHACWLNSGNITAKKGAIHLAHDAYLRIGLKIGDTSSGMTISGGQLELGSTATDYEPYVGTTYPIDWTSEAGTVYGGTLDVTTGVLTVKYQYRTLFNSGWVFYTTNTYRRPTNSPNHAKIEGNILCNVYKTLPYGSFSTNDKCICLGGGNDLIVKDTDYANVDDFMASITGQMYIAYELATPRAAIQLTPTEVKTLLGENNIFADTGEVEVTYRADIKGYIDKHIAETQALVLENLNA